MSDDRWNSEGDRPYLDEPPPPGARPAKRQPLWQDGNRFVTAEEIQAFVAQEFPETVKQKKKLVRPPEWSDDEKPAEPEVDETETFER